MPPRDKLSTLSQLFRALADPTRLRLLNLIADREICVCYFVDILDMSQPKISRHLAYLRRVGLVATRRQGRWVHYRMNPPKNRLGLSILRETLVHLQEMPELRADIAKLSRACCEPSGTAVSPNALWPEGTHSRLGQ
jgi:ArsR family transcriptional regulator, arsenate/arsenite/antimonite-responsive transcriptional repressor